MTQKPAKLDPQIRMILLTTMWFGSFISLISYVFLKDANFSAAVIAGLVLVLVNFLFLTKIVVKLLDQNYKRKAFLAALFLFKVLFVIGFVIGSLTIMDLNVVGFVLGYGSMVPVIVFSQFFTKKVSGVS